jgi:AraC-like DNA-binding protein
MQRTMRPGSHREHVRADHGSSFRVWESRLPRFPFNWHHHRDLELTWISRGRGMRLVGDAVEAFCDGDLCLIGPDLPHTWYSSGPELGPVSAWIAQFPPELFDGLASRPELRPLRALLTRAQRGVRIEGVARERAAAEMRELATLSPASPRRLAQLMRLLAGLAERLGDCRVLSRSEVAEQPSALARKRIAAAVAYAETHWRGRLSQRHAARLVGLSPSAFAQVFRRWTGRTFTGYVGELRLGGVSRALSGTTRPIAEIAFACGFGNLANFNRRFRAAHGMSPRAYRHAAAGATG